jgi:hypothetical protein
MVSLRYPAVAGARPFTLFQREPHLYEGNESKMSTSHHIERTCYGRSVRHDVMTAIPDFVKREVNTLTSDGCTNVEATHFDRHAAIWTVTFERSGKRLARLLWCVEVDA